MSNAVRETMEPQERILRQRIQDVIDVRETAETFAVWFEGITWVIRPPRMRPLPLIVALTQERIDIYRSEGRPGDELRQSLAYILAAVDRHSELPPDPLGGRPYAAQVKIRPVLEG